jgi:hypothetical protein
MGETCSTHRSDKNCVQIFFGKSERKNLPDVWGEIREVSKLILISVV